MFYFRLSLNTGGSKGEELKGLYSDFSLFRLESFQLLEKLQSMDRFTSSATETHLLSPYLPSVLQNNHC